VLLAQTIEFMFHTVRDRDGLSANSCVSLLKDKSDFLWVGIQNGLNRYDGNHFNVFNARQKTIILLILIFLICVKTKQVIFGELPEAEYSLTMLSKISSGIIFRRGMTMQEVY
jgi:hypothetical protein